MCNSTEGELSSTVIRRCGASFGGFRLLWGKRVTFFGVNDNDGDGDNNNDNSNNQQMQTTSTLLPQHTCVPSAGKMSSSRIKRNQLHFNIRREIGVKLSKGHLYGNIPKPVQKSDEGTVTIFWNQQV